MAANIQSAYFATGKHGLPWHNNGTMVSDAVNGAQAQTLAGLDWKVIEAPCYAQFMRPDNSFYTVKAEDFKMLIRNDNKHVLHVAKKGYYVLQNTEMFELAEALVGEGAGFESAGAFGKGEQVWVLARIPQSDFTVNNVDKHEAYLCVTTTHDGSGSFKAFVTYVRVVCQNTLRMAIAGAKGDTLSFRHTRTAPDRISMAKRLLAGSVTAGSKLKSQLEALTTYKLTQQDFFTVVDKLFPKPEAEAKVANANRLANLETILASYAVQSYGYTDQQGTAFNLLNAITDYTDHLRGTTKLTDASRSESAMFGQGAQFKQQALDTLYELVQAQPTAQPTASLLDQITGA